MIAIVNTDAPEKTESNQTVHMAICASDNVSVSIHDHCYAGKFSGSK